MASFTEEPNAAPTDGGAIITFETDVEGIGQVLAGTDPADLNVRALENDPTTTHYLELTGLDVGATYTYQAALLDPVDGTTLVASGNLTFVAQTPTAPVTFTSGPDVDPMDDEAVFSWVASSAGTGQVLVGEAQNNLNIRGTDDNVACEHTVTVTGLRPATMYYCQVSSLDANTGDALVSGPVASFTTDPAVVVTDACIRRAFADPRRLRKGGQATLTAYIRKNNKPVPSVAVNFELLHGQGQLSAASANTDSSGRATVKFTAGTTPGIVRIKVSSASARNKRVIHICVRRR